MVLRRLLLLILCFFYFLTFCVAQKEQKRDSLLALLRNTSSDSAKVQILLDISKIYRTAKEARPWIEKAMEVSLKANYQLGIANCLTNENLYLYIEGKYDDVLKNCDRGIKLAQPYKAHKTIGVLYNYIANVHNFKGEQRQAIIYYQKALEEINQAVVPPSFPITIQGNIVKLYLDLREYNKVLQYGLVYIAQAEKIGEENVAAYICQHVASAYKELKQPKRSQMYWEKCLKMAQNTEDSHLEAVALSNLGGIFSDADNLAQALGYYEKSLKIADEIQDEEARMYNYHGFAEVFYRQKQWAKAYEMAQSSKEIAIKNQYNEYLTALYLFISDIEIGRGRLKEADNWRTKWNELRTSIINETVLKATQEYETKYQTEKKTQQIRLLEQQQKIQILSLRQKDLLIYGLIALLGILGILSMVYYRFLKQKQRIAAQENQISNQKIRQLEQEKQLSAVDGMLKGQEEERSRLARDLHDGLGGMLSGIKSSLTAMKGNQLMQGESVFAFEKIIDTLDSSIQELRRVARNMMPEALVRFGLKDALQDYVDYLNQSANQNIDYQTFGLENRLPQSIEIIVFRIIQELLNNVQKHAAASQTILQLIRDNDRFHLTVEDNGKGFDTSQIRQKEGVGWLNITSRVDYLNGSLDVASVIGKGTTVNIEFII